ncbi:IS3 family transposase [Nonomuraea sp. NPDC049695]|uniref:IS3 family transposase n=1 Tax=Nonomuraea sp. NPDC049695 TaxID=3154734 RepID=UPI0034276F46
MAGIDSTLKIEFVHRHCFATRDKARLAIATWIADFYNTRRRPSADDWLPPIDYEQCITAAPSGRQDEGSGDHRRIETSPRSQGIVSVSI